jgi:hypothetical protein
MLLFNLTIPVIWYSGPSALTSALAIVLKTTIIFRFLFTYQFPMNRLLKVLDWNVRGVNSQERWDKISN